MNLCQYIPNLPLDIHYRESKIMTQVDLRREWRTYNRKFYPSLEKFTQTCLRRLRHLETLSMGDKQDWSWAGLEIKNINYFAK